MGSSILFDFSSISFTFFFIPSIEWSNLIDGKRSAIAKPDDTFDISVVNALNAA
ncbi:hypothetical protein BVRB_8g196150 [Beta vulgaris subsp. vulgaris]|nr:hypothetical protein BVRB_8g196150 [Beta vulgaris subsp. vulgaris]